MINFQIEKDLRLQEFIEVLEKSGLALIGGQWLIFGSFGSDVDQFQSFNCSAASRSASWNPSRAYRFQLSHLCCRSSDNSKFSKSGNRERAFGRSSKISSRCKIVFVFGRRCRGFLSKKISFLAS